MGDDYVVGGGVEGEGGVDEVGFLSGEGFLEEEGGGGGRVGVGVGVVEEGTDYEVGDPDGEDGHGVVEGVVEGEGGPVEDCWGGRGVSDGGGLKIVDVWFESWDFFFFDVRG